MREGESGLGSLHRQGKNTEFGRVDFVSDALDSARRPSTLAICTGP